MTIFLYKMKYTLNVQEVCDSDGKFIDVDCKWPGSVHDAKVFANSKINSMLRDGTLPLLYRTLVPGFDKVPVLLLADPAYTLLPHCMKEYKSCTTDEAVLFNNLLRASRNPIECAYGRLKARWQILTRPMDMKLENIPQIIYSCFVLHNFCEMNGMQMDDEQIKMQVAFDKEQGPNLEPDRIFSYNSSEGERIRHAITVYIKEHLSDHLSQS